MEKDASPGATAMTQLNIERQPEAVKRFFETLALKPGGSMFELNGKRVTIRVYPDADTEWTKAKNDRRCALIERDIDGTITPDESLELELLQEAMSEHVERVAPLPLDYARELHQRMVQKAMNNGTA